MTQQSQEEVARVKEQLAFQVEQVKREAELKVSPWVLGGGNPNCETPRSLQTKSGFVLADLGLGDGLQLEDQSVQMEQLRQELEARRDELDQAQRSLGHAKQVLQLGAQTCRAQC